MFNIKNEKTMKKTYSNPETKVVLIAARKFLCESTTLTSKGNYGSGSGITLGSRRGSFDDYDDEE